MDIIRLLPRDLLELQGPSRSSRDYNNTTDLPSRSGRRLTSEPFEGWLQREMQLNVFEIFSILAIYHAGEDVRTSHSLQMFTTTTHRSISRSAEFLSEMRQIIDYFAELL